MNDVKCTFSEKNSLSSSDSGIQLEEAKSDSEKINAMDFQVSIE